MAGNRGNRRAPHWVRAARSKRAGGGAESPPQSPSPPPGLHAPMAVLLEACCEARTCAEAVCALRAPSPLPAQTALARLGLACLRVCGAVEAALTADELALYVGCERASTASADRPLGAVRRFDTLCRTVRAIVDNPGHLPRDGVCRCLAQLFVQCDVAAAAVHLRTLDGVLMRRAAGGDMSRTIAWGSTPESPRTSSASSSFARSPAAAVRSSAAAIEAAFGPGTAITPMGPPPPRAAAGADGGARRRSRSTRPPKCAVPASMHASSLVYVGTAADSESSGSSSLFSEAPPQMLGGGAMPVPRAPAECYALDFTEQTDAEDDWPSPVLTAATQNLAVAATLQFLRQCGGMSGGARLVQGLQHVQQTGAQEVRWCASLRQALHAHIVSDTAAADRMVVPVDADAELAPGRALVRIDLQRVHATAGQYAMFSIAELLRRLESMHTVRVRYVEHMAVARPAAAGGAHLVDRGTVPYVVGAAYVEYRAPPAGLWANGAAGQPSIAYHHALACVRECANLWPRRVVDVIVGADGFAPVAAWGYSGPCATHRTATDWARHFLPDLADVAVRLSADDRFSVSDRMCLAAVADMLRACGARAGDEPAALVMAATRLLDERIQLATRCASPTTAGGGGLPADVPATPVLDFDTADDPMCAGADPYHFDSAEFDALLASIEPDASMMLGAHSAFAVPAF